MRRPVALAILSLLIHGCGDVGGNAQNAASAQGFEASFKQGFKTSFRDKFVGQCVSGAKQSSGSTADFGTVCGCAADKLLATKSVSELTIGPDQKDLREVVAQCAKEHPIR